LADLFTLLFAAENGFAAKSSVNKSAKVVLRCGGECEIAVPTEWRKSRRALAAFCEGCGSSKIFDAVVIGGYVRVIEIARRPLPIKPEPSESVSAVAPPVNPY
jgi:hypothetical protein